MSDEAIEYEEEVTTQEVANEPVEEAEESGTSEAVEAEPGEAQSVDAEPQDSDEKQRKSGVQKRIDELTREKWEAKRQAEYWQQMAQQQRQEPQPTQAPPELQAPSPENFDSYDEYVAAQASFAAAKALEAQQAKLQQQQENQRRAEAQRAREARFMEQASGARSKYQDYDEVVQNPSLPITRVMAQVIQESDAGAELAYFLGKNPQVADNISRLNPVQVVRELARIEFNLSKDPEPQKPAKPVTPVTTVGGKETTKADPEKMTVEQWLEWRNSNAKPR